MVKRHVKKAIKGLHLYSFGVLRKLYDWTISWADTPYGAAALFILAFAEASFFIIPPDALLIALCISAHKKSFKFALIALAGSVTGGMFGYFIGWALYGSVGSLIIQALHYEHYFEKVGVLFQDNAFLALLGAAFTPIPYKVFTIAAGVWKINFFVLVICSIMGRGLRFFIVATLIFFLGKRIKTFIDKYFEWLTVLFFILLVAGFIVIKYLL